MKGQPGLYEVSLSSVGVAWALWGAAWALQGNSVLRTNSKNNMKSSQLATYARSFPADTQQSLFFFSTLSGAGEGQKEPAK